VTALGDAFAHVQHRAETARRRPTANALPLSTPGPDLGAAPRFTRWSAHRPGDAAAALETMPAPRCRPSSCRAAMTDELYGTLAGVYDWLVPDALLAPEGNVAAFAQVVEKLDRGARVLDCAAGTGQLAVGLALRGFKVVATDASCAMIEHTRKLADRHGVDLEAIRCPWSKLDRQDWEHAFDAVFCVGNSLAHATGSAGRRAALAAMRAVLRDGGLLVVTSRNWEQLRATRPRLQVTDTLIERDGRHGLVIHAWTIPDAWDKPHYLDLAVAIFDQAGDVTTLTERLPFSPFTYQTLDADVRAAEMTPLSSTYTPDTDRYLVTARRDPRPDAGTGSATRENQPL
jgi:2-polyprenyl-3-methyl-5-hydroxy-6-metoxy-1,4-benzoquinol methylase